MAFLLGGEDFTGAPRVIVRRRDTGRDFPHSPERWAERGFPGCSGTDPGGIQLDRIPIGGSFGISNRCDKKSVFYKSVSQPL